MNCRPRSNRDRVARFALVLFFTPLAACVTATAIERNPRTYYCIGGAVPVPPANTWGKKYVTEEFDFGEYKINASTIAKGIFGHSRCGTYTVPSSAYLRYRFDGQLVEKRFDLSALNPSRVANKTVEFYVVDDVVEVRLLSVADKTYIRNVEVITKQ